MSTRAWLNIADFVVAVEKSLHLDLFQIINIGHPEVIKTKDLALLVCKKLNVEYKDYIVEIDQPPQMTLNKEPDLSKQDILLNFKPTINIHEGINLLC